MDRTVSGARFLTGGVVESDISHRRSVDLISTALPQHGTLPTLLALLLTSVPHALFATHALLPGHLYEISHTKL